MMLAFMGIYAAKLLPADKSLRVLGIPNRLFIAGVNSAAGVIVEIFLNAVDALTSPTGSTTWRECGARPSPSGRSSPSTPPA
jgi:hypothetical protein